MNEQAEGEAWRTKFTRPNGSFEKNEEGKIAFVPLRLPPDIARDATIMRQLTLAERKIGELKGMGAFLKNSGMLIRACLKREAVLSSMIEGTTATLCDLNMHEAIGGVSKSMSDSTRLQEVINYVDALNEALNKMREGDCSISLDTMRQAHATLMEGVRGGDKKPGQFREQQNYIVAYKGGVPTIRYVPPPYGTVPSLLDNLVEFVRDTPDVEVSGLVQCAVAHYQFEAIHPFLDGNGRVGRVIIPLILHSKDVLPEPLLYLSGYFEKNREEYYIHLRGVSQASEWREWIMFFLEAVREQACESIETMKAMARLEKKYSDVLAEKKAGANARLLIPSLFANPYTTIPRACRELGRSYPASKRAIDELVGAGILQQARVRYKGRVFYAREIDEALGGV